MKLIWSNTGRSYKCYSDVTGFILGVARESDDGDGTYSAYVEGEHIGDYINLQSARNAVERNLKDNPIYKRLIEED